MCVSVFYCGSMSEALGLSDCVYVSVVVVLQHMTVCWSVAPHVNDRSYNNKRTFVPLIYDAMFD